MRFPQHSLGALWRARRWRYLLNLIDHLPADTHYAQAVALDEEHARMIVGRTKDAEKTPYSPPMATWSAESALLAALIDEVRGLRYVTVAVNSKQKPNPPMPYPRPRTALDKVRLEEREKAHRSLVARVLPHKTK